MGNQKCDLQECSFATNLYDNFKRKVLTYQQAPEVVEDGDDEEVGLVAKIPEDAEVVGVFRRRFPNKFIPLEMKFAEIEKVCHSK